jgi:glycosyltransferase involved in cell wall biosynthesis
MRILFLTPQLPYPPHQGTAKRNFGLLQGLARGHRVSLLSFREPDPRAAGSVAARETPDALTRLCERVETVPAPPSRRLIRRAIDTLTQPLPDMALRLASQRFAERLVGWMAAETFDVIHIEGIEMAPYLDQLLDAGTGARKQFEGRRLPAASVESDAAGRAPMLVFDDHNCEYMLQKRYAQVDARIPRRWTGAIYSLIQWQKLRRYEAEVCRRVDRVLAVSQSDASALERLVRGLHVTVIPNGIDTTAYVDYTTATDVVMPVDRSPALVFVGKMDFRPNVDAVSWFIKRVWPLIRTAVPEAHFYAVGQRPHPQLIPLGKDPTVTLTGWVQDVRPYVARAAVYVAPLRMGSGTRLKLLEAMALGKAIVSTRLGAEGLAHANEPQRPNVSEPDPAVWGKARHDQEIVIVADNDPAAFADAVVTLMQDPARQERLGAAAQAFVKTHYDWRSIIPRLEAVYPDSRNLPKHSPMQALG